MTERLWPLKELQRFLRYEDPEVRFWAADRIVHHFPVEGTASLSPFLFDDHEVTPELVAAHLGRHGGPEHLPGLDRALRSLKGGAAARSLEALVRLRAPEAIDRVRAAFDRRDFDEEGWSGVLAALADRADPAARRVLDEFLRKRADWYGSPAILRSALQVAGPGEYRPRLQAWIRSIQWRGAGGSGAGDGSSGESFRVLMDHLQIDDVGWCFRTSLSGRIDFARTLKAIESSYDCTLRSVLGDVTCGRIASILDEGDYRSSVEVLVDTVRQLAGKLRRSPGDDLIDRITEVTLFWVDPEVLRAVEGLGPHLREWIIGFLLSAVVSMARYRNYELEMRRAAGDPDVLLDLLQIETSLMLDHLPGALARSVEAAGPAAGPSRSAARRSVEERCLQILAARGPFFPQVMALETLGELRSAGAVNEIIDFLNEDNAYLYEAAEHALAEMGAVVIDQVRPRLEAGNLDEDAAHSLLIALSEIGSAEALRLVLDHFDFFIEAVGVGDAARWMSLFGARELIEPLRRRLQTDLPMVGQALLLLGGVHNVRIPEETAIRAAIDDWWKQQPEDGEEAGAGDGTDKYLM